MGAAAAGAGRAWRAVSTAATVGSSVAWRAVDITIDEVSMARNWRGQFRRILDRDGFDVLIQKIEKKANKRP